MSLYFQSVDGVALVAATAKSLIELGTSSTIRVKIKEYWIEFDGVTATAVPVKIELGRFSAAVTTATSASEQMDLADGTPGSTLKHSTTSEGAGTANDVMIHRIPPTSGYHYIAPLGQEMLIPVSAFWRMRATAAAAVNATFGIIWEE